mgnify:CR=1 FL=1
MKKKIICAILVTALAVTSFTGCGKAQDKDAAEVIMAETETRDPDITAEAQAAVDTLLPAETGKPVVTETATPTPKPVATKEPETTATSKPAATVTPKATATPKPATATAGSATATVSNSKPSGDSNKTGTTATAAPAEKETPAATAKPAASTPAPTAVPTPAPTAAPCNHNFVKSYWPSAPTCNGGGYYNLKCTICGANGGDGTDPALPHTPATRVEVDATYCDEHGIVVTYCTSCGNVLGSAGFDGTEHEWTTGTYEAWDEDTHTVVEKERTYCSRCGVSQ